MNYEHLKNFLRDNNGGAGDAKPLYDALSRVTPDKGQANISRLLPPDNKEDNNQFFALIAQKMQKSGPETQLVLIDLIGKMAQHAPHTVTNSDHIDNYARLCVYNIMANHDLFNGAFSLQMNAAFAIFNLSGSDKTIKKATSSFMVSILGHADTDQSPLFPISNKNRHFLQKLAVNAITQEQKLPADIYSACITIARRAIEETDWAKEIMLPLLFDADKSLSYRSSFLTTMASDYDRFLNFIHEITDEREMRKVIYCEDLKQKLRLLAAEKHLAYHLSQGDYTMAIYYSLGCVVEVSNKAKEFYLLEIADHLFKKYNEDQISFDSIIDHLYSLRIENRMFFRQTIATQQQFMTKKFLKELKKSKVTRAYLLRDDIFEAQRKQTLRRLNPLKRTKSPS